MSSSGSTRTYNPNVRVGNWNEEICLEEDILKDFLEKQENGTLLIQRTQSLMHTLLEKTELNKSDTVTIGGQAMLVNPGRDGIVSDDKQMENLPRQLLNGRKNTSVSVNVDEWPVGGLQTLAEEPMALSGAPNSETACVRNTFKIIGKDRKEGEPLHYGDKFCMQSVLGKDEISKNLLVFSDRMRLGQATSTASRKLGGISPMQLVPVDNLSSIPYGAFFVAESADPLLRMEHEGLPVPVDQPILLRHCSTGQHLAVLDDSSFRTPFGNELSIGAKTFYNSHKAERDNNYWVFRQ